MINNINAYQNTNLLKTLAQQKNNKPQNNSVTNKNTPNTEPPKTERVSTSIFYINDIHGRIGNMSRIFNAKHAYDVYTKNSTADKLVLSAGDIAAGADDHIIKAANTFMKGLGVDATSDGNHEYDANPPELAKAKENAPFKSLGMNLQIPTENPLNKIIDKFTVIEKNGHKYGIIGIAPPDLHERIRDNDSRKQIGVDDFKTTLQELQKYADEFKQQGINKVIVLSHCGLTKDQEIAKTIDGIDVIIGGHTHDLLSGITEDKNLFYSKSGEPIVITQAGKDGEHFGVLNLEFDKDGIITKVQNNVTPSTKFKRSNTLRGVFDTIMGKAEKLGEIKSATGPTVNRLIDPNPNGYFIMDAVRNEFGTDLALINVGNIRGFFEPGPIDSRQVFEVVPLKNNMVKLKLTEKEIVDALKNGAKSFINPGNKPSIVIPSGLKYTVTRSGEIKSVTIMGKDGHDINVDVNNPDPKKTYTVATDDFFASGGDNLIPNKIKTNEIDETFNFDKDKLTCDYIKKLQGPIEIKDDGRIQVID